MDTLYKPYIANASVPVKLNEYFEDYQTLLRDGENNINKKFGITNTTFSEEQLNELSVSCR